MVRVVTGLAEPQHIKRAAVVIVMCLDPVVASTDLASGQAFHVSAFDRIPKAIPSPGVLFPDDVGGDEHRLTPPLGQSL